MHAERTIVLRITFVLMCFWSSSLAFAADITGRWFTLDSDSGEKRSIVEIKQENGHFRGRIVELFLNPDEPLDPHCDLCTGELHGRRIRGLEILELDESSNEIGYVGKLLDPEGGDTYKCVATLDAAGKRLSIRGYVGLPIFGRNVTWARVE